jgi:hypothetical protein
MFVIGDGGHGIVNFRPSLSLTLRNFPTSMLQIEVINGRKMDLNCLPQDALSRCRLLCGTYRSQAS